MELYSRARDFEINNFSELFNELDGALRKVSVVSAYYDKSSIRQLINLLQAEGDGRTRKELIIILDRGSSNFAELLELDKEIQKNIRFSDSSGIFVARTSGGIFHSKGYLAETNTDGELFIGSMNLTQKGISGNEELVLDGRYRIGSQERTAYLANRFTEYVNYLLEEKAQPVREVDFKQPEMVNDIRSFFLDGRIFYETKEQSPFRFELKLPDELLRTESPLNDLLESVTSNSLDIAALVTNKRFGLGFKLPERRGEKASWKKYCIQTCYGYWCPNEHHAYLQEELDRKIKIYRPYYEALRKKVIEDSGQLLDQLITLSTDLVTTMKDRGVEAEWKYHDPEELKKAWERKVQNIQNRLEIPDYLERLSCGVSNVATPDIWNDPSSVEDFEESAFSSVLYEIAKAGSREPNNWAAHAFSVELDINSESSPSEVRAKLSRFLKLSEISIFIDAPEEQAE